MLLLLLETIFGQTFAERLVGRELDLFLGFVYWLGAVISSIAVFLRDTRRTAHLHYGFFVRE